MRKGGLICGISGVIIATVILFCTITMGAFTVIGSRSTDNSGPIKVTLSEDALRNSTMGVVNGSYCLNSKFAPFLVTDSEGNKAYCGWTIRHTMIRSAVLFLDLIFTLFITLSFIRSFKWALFMGGLFSIFMCIISLVDFGYDLQRINRTKGWCDNNTPGATFFKSDGSAVSVTCNLNYFYAPLALNAVAGSLWLISAILCFRIIHNKSVSENRRASQEGVRLMDHSEDL